MVKIITLLVLALTSCGIGNASVITLDFSELPQQAVDGLTYKGVTFGYTGGATALYNYDTTLGAMLQNLTDPVLFGDSAGMLTLQFSDPTPFLRFKLAFGTSDDSAFLVQLTGPGFPLSGLMVPGTTTLAIALSEGAFDYDNTVNAPLGALIQTAVITFTSSSNIFALDNLTYDPAPEPGTWLLIAPGALLAVTHKLLARR